MEESFLFFFIFHNKLMLLQIVQPLISMNNWILLYLDSVLVQSQLTKKNQEQYIYSIILYVNNLNDQQIISNLQFNVLNNKEQHTPKFKLVQIFSEFQTSDILIRLDNFTY
ncbi:unnamed protein product [Paramecium octaurelia]|uniref:Uncharacterized protein n=1 Tax=Paramecium octaurelia TaxID=43137 RepID=A0A8S1YHI9_PAROT|nr:unnamed protein product [Paramecium octaurelia]